MGKSVRQTSAKAYYKIKNEGLLSKMRMLVFESIHILEPCTASEVFQYAKLKTNQSGRITELLQMGVIEEAGIVNCPVTQINVMSWKLSGKMPKALPKKDSRPAKFEKAVEYIVKKMQENQLLYITAEEISQL